MQCLAGVSGMFGLSDDSRCFFSSPAAASVSSPACRKECLSSRSVARLLCGVAACHAPAVARRAARPPRIEGRGA